MDQNVARDLIGYKLLQIPYPAVPICYRDCRFEWPSSGMITVVLGLIASGNTYNYSPVLHVYCSRSHRLTE